MAKPLKDQSLFVFGLSMGFAAALRPFCPEIGPVMVEIVGPKGSGKSTVQQVVASAMGPIGVGAGGRYQTPCDAFGTAGSAVVAGHADMLTVVEDVDMSLAGESPGSQSKRVKAMLYHSSARGGEVPPGFITEVGANLFALSSSMRSIAEMAGEAPDVARAGAERLITVPIGWDRPFGVFDSVPDGYDDAGQFAASLSRAAAQNHGTAFRAFIEALVLAVAADRKAVQKQIDGYRRGFRRTVQVDGNDGAAVRLAEVFALIYAGRRLATLYGILPKGLKIRDSVAACYRMAKAGAVQRQDFRSRLEDLAADADTIQLGKEAEELSPAARVRARVFIRTRSDRRELIIPARFIEHVFPDWAQLSAREDVKATMIKDDDQWRPRVELDRVESEGIHTGLIC